MSIIAIGMNLMLAGLIVAALMMGLRLNARLKALRDSHEGFAKAVAELDAAAARAEQGLADLRAATDEAHDALADRIEKARALTAKLDRQLQAAPQVSARAEPASRNEPLRMDTLRRPAPVRDELELDADVERVTHRLGSLLSGAREPKPERERFSRREPPPARARPALDDDLFDDQPLRAGGRR
jgi:hypothetical protein